MGGLLLLPSIIHSSSQQVFISYLGEMRLLHTTELRVQYFPSNDIPVYAIFSHTWGAEEVTLQDMENRTFIGKSGFHKVQYCCKLAAKDGYTWIWVDTCTIDKASSAELTEAINSMFSWYGDSAMCYAYLEDVEVVQDLAKSKWFTRGWTLQELIAPRSVSLLDRNWQQIGTKRSLSDDISRITGIPKRVLRGTSPLTCNIAQRMSWGVGKAYDPRRRHGLLSAGALSGTHAVYLRRGHGGRISPTAGTGPRVIFRSNSFSLDSLT